jgi:hypothetical protein
MDREEFATLMAVPQRGTITRFGGGSQASRAQSLTFLSSNIEEPDGDGSIRWNAHLMGGAMSYSPGHLQDAREHDCQSAGAAAWKGALR